MDRYSSVARGSFGTQAAFHVLQEELSLTYAHYQIPVIGRPYFANSLTTTSFLVTPDQ